MKHYLVQGDGGAGFEQLMIERAEDAHVVVAARGGADDSWAGVARVRRCMGETL